MNSGQLGRADYLRRATVTKSGDIQLVIDQLIKAAERRLGIRKESGTGPISLNELSDKCHDCDFAEGWLGAAGIHPPAECPDWWAWYETTPLGSAFAAIKESAIQLGWHWDSADRAIPPRR